MGYRLTTHAFRGLHGFNVKPEIGNCAAVVACSGTNIRKQPQDYAQEPLLRTARDSGNVWRQSSFRNPNRALPRTWGARVTAVRGSASNRLINAIGRGVVVMSCRGRKPRRERRIDMVPLGKLVAPRGIELRAAQLLGIFRRKCQPDRAIRPFQPAARRCPLRALVPWRYPQNTGRTLDHDLAHVVLGLSDESNV